MPFLAATSAGVVRIADGGERWDAELVHPLEGCSGVAVGGGAAYAGSRLGGVVRSGDGGTVWQAAGLEGLKVTAVAAADGLLVAGTEPTAVYRSDDGGSSWEELDEFRRIPSRRFWFFPGAPPFRAYVSSVAIAGDALVVGIEAGAVVRSGDGGRTWEDHRPGALRDCHQLALAPDGERIYEAGGNGGGAAASDDAGETWRRAPLEEGRRYGVAVATDGERWYAASSPSPWAAHGNRDARAAIYRRESDRWRNLTPDLLSETPFALCAPEPGRLVAGLRNGEIWASEDAGETLRKVCEAPPGVRALAATTR